MNNSSNSYPLRSKKINYKLYFLLFPLLVLFSCDINNLLDPNLPKWTIDLEVPLLDKTILLRDNILDIDSSIVLYPNINPENIIDSIFVYKLVEKIDSTFIDDKLNIQDVIDTTITQSIDAISVANTAFIETINFSEVGIGSVYSELSTEIGLINLDDINEQNSEAYTLESLLPEFYETISSFLNSSSDPYLADSLYDEDVIGSISNSEITPTSNNIEFTSFQYANFQSGNLKIKIDNSLMYLNFQDIIITLKDNSTNNLLKTIDIGNMDGGEIYDQIVNLGNLPNDGYLPNNLIITISGIVTGISPGTTYNQLLSSKIEIPISANDLVVSETSAKIPEQNFNDSGSFILENDNKIIEAIINTGFLKIALDNNLPENLGANISINIPNILDVDENPLLIHFNMLDVINPIDLTGYKIDIQDINNQQIFYNYFVSTIDTDNYVTISQTDNININFKLVGNIENQDQEVTFSSINGIINDQEENISGEIVLDIEGAIIQDAIFSSGEIIVEIINNITDASLDIQIVIDEFLLEEVPFTKNIILSSSYSQIFSLENYTLTPSYINEISKVSYNAIARSSNDSSSQYNLTEDIIINITIQNIIIKEVTGSFDQEPIVETNSINLESDNIIDDGILESGNIEITIDNNLGLLADIIFSIDEILDSQGNSFNYTIALENSQKFVSIDLSNYSINLNNNPDSDSYQTISYKSEVVINSEEISTLNLENNIEIRFVIPNLNFSYINGYIAPVEVEIPPFSKSDLNILPDDIEGIVFNSANAYLDFDSALNLDLLLQLDFYAANSNTGEAYSFQFLEETLTSIDRIYLNPDDILSMINIVPDSISVSGLATVSGDGIINSSDAISAEFTIEIPFEFIFNDNTSINIPSSELSEDIIPDMFDSMILYYQYEIPFNFNTYLSIYCSNDNFEIIDDSNKFTAFELISSENTITDSIEISADKFDLLNSSSFIKPIINIISNTGDNQDYIPYSFYSTDSLNIKLWTKIGILIDENE